MACRVVWRDLVIACYRMTCHSTRHAQAGGAGWCEVQVVWRAWWWWRPNRCQLCGEANTRAPHRGLMDDDGHVPCIICMSEVSKVSEEANTQM